MKYLLGVDIGTTSLKAAVFNEKAECLKTVVRDYTLDVKDDYVEFRADGYWELFLDALEELSKDYKISAMSIDTQCETIIVTNENGDPLRNAIVWLDNRAVKEADEIKDKFGEKKVYEITGQPEITPTWPASKLLWLKKNEPELFGKIKKVFLLEDYLLYKLTGKFVTEKTLQSSTIYYDIKNNVWWKDMLDFIGVSADILPEILPSGEIIGEYKGITVVTGAIDQIAGAIGAGIVKKGVVSEMTGTTMVVFVPSDKIPEYSEGSKIPCHVNYDGKYCLLSWTPTAGIALKWFKNNFCEGMDFKKLDELAESVPAGSAGLTFLPYLCGSTMPKYDPEARGVFYGLTMEHTRAHLTRSIFEAVSCMLKENLDYMGIETTEIRSMGGGASSDIWCQIKADMTKKRIVTLKNKETACLGSAILAGVATGVFESIESACDMAVEINKAYEPTDTDYTKCYENYIEIGNKLFFK